MNEPIKPVDLEAVQKIGDLIAADKYEHATQDPIFLVQQKIRDYGYSEDYTSDFEWFDNDRQEIVDERIAKRLSTLDSNYREIPKKYTKICYQERWEFVTCCFTREGAEAFIKRQAHNLKETRIWVDSLFRNAEMIAVREYLKSNEVESLRERVKELESINHKIQWYRTLAEDLLRKTIGIAFELSVKWYRTSDDKIEAIKKIKDSWDDAKYIVPIIQ